MKDILHDESFSKVELINKGWSSDKKFYVETKSGEKMLLRVSDISEYEEKKHEFELMKRISEIGINMSKPIDFGVCNRGKSVYQLLTWCEGEEAKELLPSLSIEKQYEYGRKAGLMLREMQSVESTLPSSDWAIIYGSKVRKYIETYMVCGGKLTGDDILISFIDKHINCLDNRPMCLLHADFQSDNMVISPDGELYAIDFQGSGLVDPYYALTGVMVTAEVSPAFSTGQLHSFFDNHVPEDFWELNAFYMAAESINAFSVAVTLGKEEMDYSNELMKRMFVWFDNLNNLIPSWYSDDEVR